jgi:hypothetical protein
MTRIISMVAQLSGCGNFRRTRVRHAASIQLQEQAFRRNEDERAMRGWSFPLGRWMGVDLRIHTFFLLLLGL